MLSFIKLLRAIWIFAFEVKNLNLLCISDKSINVFPLIKDIFYKWYALDLDSQII